MSLAKVEPENIALCSAVGSFWHSQNTNTHISWFIDCVAIIRWMVEGCKKLIQTLNTNTNTNTNIYTIKVDVQDGAVGW